MNSDANEDDNEKMNNKTLNKRTFSPNDHIKESKNKVTDKETPSQIFEIFEYLQVFFFFFNERETEVWGLYNSVA